MTFSDESNDGISYLLVFCSNGVEILTKCTGHMLCTVFQICPKATPNLDRKQFPTVS